jgi:uncharacterized protein (TIGR00288 family)
MAEHALAVLVDFENMARPGSKSRGDFNIDLVLNRLAEKGRVLVKRAYADWGRYREAKQDLQNAGLELIEMPSAREGAKNRADIKLAVDAMELAYSREHVDNFVIVSGDSDFTPLVGKLRELNKRVTGVGNKESASELLIANCDEFIFYDNLAASGRGSTRRATRLGGPDPIELLRETVTALQREGTEFPLASVVKDSMRRKAPAFDEAAAGFSTFSKFLEDAQGKGIVRLHTDPRSGTYRVELAEGAAVPAPPRIAEERQENGEGRRRRRRSRRGEPAPAASRPEIAGDGEVFEYIVPPRAPELELPPLDEPISYEDMVLLTPELELGPEVDAEVPDLAEVSDVPEPAPPTRGARRRRRRLTGEPEPTAADLEPGPAAVTEAVPEPEPQPGAEVVEAAEAETPARTSRRRVRRGSTTPPGPAPAPPAEDAAPVAEPAADEAPVEEAPKPRRRTRKTAAEKAAEAEAPVEEAPAEEAPKPRRRTRKTAEPVEA